MRTHDQPMTVTLSVARKVNLGNYESADVFMSINNVPLDASHEDIDAALVTGKLTFDVLKVAVTERARELRNP